MRRFLLDIVSVMAPATYRFPVRSGLAMGVIFFSTAVHIHTKPFILDSINTLEGFSLSVATVTLIAAEMVYLFAAQPDVSEASWPAIATGVALFSNCALVVGF